ncbi:MAG: hypothetical protein WDN24_11375 [Sphingomonas sp.]
MADVIEMKAGQADRAALEAIVDSYLDALVAGDPGRAPFAADAAFAENGQRLALGTAAWRTIEALGRYRHVFADPDRGDVGVIANVVERGAGAILIVRLKVADGAIVEAEQFVSRDPDGFRRYEELGAPDAIWLEPVPEAARQSREALEAVSWMYFQALERNDGAGIYFFTGDCQRLEHGRKAIATGTDEDYGHAETAVSFTSLKAKQQYQLGLMGYITRARDRRALVVDAERGAVLGSCVFDFDGDVESVRLTDGSNFRIPSYFRTPRSHQMNEAFKVVRGDVAYIEMTLVEVPHASRPAWTRRPTAEIRFDAPKPRKGPVEAGDAAALRALMARVVDAMLANCPCDLPLAADALCTENGVPVAPGLGIWKSLRARGPLAVLLADPETGQAGYWGDFDENGLYAAVALRLRLEGGWITELEAIVARPENRQPEGELAEATHTMFSKPLGIELTRGGMTAPAGSAGAPRDTLRAAVEAYARGGAGAVERRENGVPAPKDPALAVPTRRRTLVADAEAGLVLDLALVDHPGDAAAGDAFAAPATDLHARLLSVHGGAVARVDAVVRRTAYGSAGPWDEAIGR